MYWELVVLAGCLSLPGPSLHDLSHPSPIRATPRGVPWTCKAGPDPIPRSGVEKRRGSEGEGEMCPSPHQPSPKLGCSCLPPAQKGQDIVPSGAGTPSGHPSPPSVGKERAGKIKV